MVFNLYLEPSLDHQLVTESLYCSPEEDNEVKLTIINCVQASFIATQLNWPPMVVQNIN